MADHDVGEPFRLGRDPDQPTKSLFEVDGTPTDPTTVSLTVVSPSGTSTTYTYADAQITHDGTGNYHRDITPDVAGWWRYYWVGTGACAVTQQGEVYVRALPG